MNKKLLAIFFAILAAGLYAINIPLSKLLLNYIEPTMMASYLYLGAGIGIGIVFLITRNKDKEVYEKITKIQDEISIINSQIEDLTLEWLTLSEELENL